VVYLVINENMAVLCDDHCGIENLLQTPFSLFSFGDKHKIIEQRAPKPNVNLHTKIKTCRRQFNTSLYEAIPWLWV
jgi:hypothetical protein